MASRAVRLVLIIMTIFLALTAFAGGIGLIADLNAPSLDMLKGSLFHNYIGPGLALFVIVGGTASVAACLLIKRHSLSALGSLLSGLVIIVFEFVEVMAIGSPPGIARDLQIFYFTLGSLIVAFSIAFRVVKPAAPRPTQATPAWRAIPNPTPRLGRGEKLSAAKAVTGATSNSPIGEVSR